MKTATPASRKMTITTPAPREIRTERVFDAPRERVWRAFTEPQLLAQWWGRGNKLVIERFELQQGGRWRVVEHAPEGTTGFEGKFREVSPQDFRYVQTFEWDGMPGHVIVEHVQLEDLGDGRTKVVNVSQFHTPEERDGFLKSGFDGGMNESYAALDRLLATL